MTDWRRALPQVYQTFFGRFDALTQVQVEAMPPILNGRPVLICSATASGKTEAYAAPAAEMILRQKLGSASVIVVSPTRALANDLFRRLDARMHDLHIDFGRRTGEYKEKMDGRLPQIFITTPESLDSMLARQPHNLKNLRLVILDEIHILDGSSRGDQLRILLHRLQSLLDPQAQLVAASATVARPKELAERYLGKDAVVVQVPGARRIKAKCFHGQEPSDFGQHLNVLAEAGIRKVLVFCNSRKEVERLATKTQGISRFDDRIFAHHGSLSRAQRERTEKQFESAPAAVCFATMTLEMGIDIGSVDYVLMNGPPSSIASLLQRMGRGGRREQETRAGFVVGSAVEEFLFRVMLRAGARGELLSRHYAFRPDVIIQQALVLSGSESRIDAREVTGLLPPEIRAEYGLDEVREILDRLVTKDRLEIGLRNSFVLSEPLELRYRRGVLHSNLSDEVDSEVIDRMTGDVIGRIAQGSEAKLQLGGGHRKVISQSEGRVLTDRSHDGGDTKFSSRGIPGVTFLLARRVVEDLGCPLNRLITFPGNSHLILLHGLGSVGGMFLAEQVLRLNAGKRVVADIGPYSLRLNCDQFSDLEIPENAIESFVKKHEKKLAKMASVGPHHADLPDDLRRTSLANILELRQICHWLKAASCSPADPASLKDFDLALAI